MLIVSIATVLYHQDWCILHGAYQKDIPVSRHPVCKQHKAVCNSRVYTSQSNSFALYFMRPENVNANVECTHSTMTTQPFVNLAV